MAVPSRAQARLRDEAAPAADAVAVATVSGVELAKRWGVRAAEAAFVLVVTLFAYRNRMLPYPSLTRGEHVYYVGTDPYYHYRVVLATIANFPQTLRFDPFTHYPFGTGAGQFGSLFDVGAALFAILMGAAGDRLATAQALAIWPALVGAFVFVPFYFLARRLTGGRVGAAFATVALVLIPGEWLVRSLAGYADHHVAEALGLIVGTLGAFVAVESAAKRADKLKWPLTDRRALAPLAAAIVLGGLGITLYFLVWPPAILLVGIFGVFLAVHLFVDHAQGKDTTYLAVGGGGPFLVAGVLLLPTAETTQLNFNTFSLIQPISCLMLAAGIVALHYAGRALASRDAHRAILPTGATALGLGAFFSLQWVMPSLYGSLKWGASWVTGIGVKREILTIAEAQPSSWAGFRGDYHWLIAVFVVTLVTLAVAYAWRRRRADLLLLVMSLVLFQAARTQVRFNYYLAIVVALAYGWMAGNLSEVTGLNRALDRVLGRGTDAPAAKPKARARGSRAKAAVGNEAAFAWHQPVALGVVALFLIPGLLVPGANADGERAWSECVGGVPDYPAWVLGKCFGGPDHDNVLWVESLDWMRVSTPSSGFDVNELHERPPTGEHPTYPDGSYGVLSWWDYGHWIQVEGERPPVANPFQQAAPFASCWFTETDPVRAEGFLQQWGERGFRRNTETCPTLPVPDVDSNGAADVEHPVRYVMIDDEMAAGKFGAIAVWAGLQGKLGSESKEFRTEDGRELALPWTGEWYRDTQTYRLYFEDAKDLSHYRLVHETPTLGLIGSIAVLTGEGGYTSRFNTLFNRYGTTQLEEFGMHANFASGDRLIPFSDTEYLYDARVAASVKTFEHVQGALVEGTGAGAGETVTAAVRMKVDTNGREFTWTATTTAGADGSWSIRVPYATTDYVPAAEGGTDLVVKATGKAVFFTGPAENPTAGAEADVPDRAVLEGGVVRVQLG